jgi:KUP system potassium uptake protein
VSSAEFLREIERDRRPRVRGTIVFLTRLSRRVPPIILRHVRQIGAIPQTIVALTVRFVDRPRLRRKERLAVEQIGPSFWHVTLRYGFFEFPDIPKTFADAEEQLSDRLDLDDQIYFAERDEIVPKPGTRFWRRWRTFLFGLMFRNSVHAVDRFGLPAA